MLSAFFSQPLIKGGVVRRDGRGCVLSLGGIAKLGKLRFVEEPPKGDLATAQTRPRGERELLSLSSSSSSSLFSLLVPVLYIEVIKHANTRQTRQEKRQVNETC